MASVRTLSTAKVVAAATEIARWDGLQKLTMSTLAKKLNIRSQSLYHYICNRDELVSLVGAHVLNELHQQIVDSIVGLSGKTAIIKMGDIVRQEIIKQPFMTSVFYMMQVNPHEHNVQAAMEKIVEIVKKIINEDDVLNKTVDPQMLVGAAFGFIFIDLLPDHRSQRDLQERQSAYDLMIMRLISPNAAEEKGVK